MYKKAVILKSHLLVYKSKLIMLISFISIFIFGGSKLLQAALLQITHCSILGWVEPFYFLIAELIFVICLYLTLLLIVKKSENPNFKQLEKMSSKFKNIVDFLLILSPLILLVSIKILLLRFSSVGVFHETAIKVASVIVLFLLLSLSHVVILAAVFTVNNSSCTLEAYSCAIRCILKNKLKGIMLFLYLLLIIILTIVASQLSSNFLSYISVSVFYKQIFKLIIISATAGILIPSYYIFIIDMIYDLKNNEDSQGINKKPHFKNLAILLSILLLLSCLVSIMPVKYSLQQFILKTIDKEYRTAEQYVKLKLLDLAGYHYKRCYTLCGSTLAYTQLLEVLSDPSRSQVEVSKAYQDFDAGLIFWNGINPFNGLSYYFNAIRYAKAGDATSSLKQLEYANQLLPLFPNAGLKLLSSYEETLTNIEASKITESENSDILKDKILTLEEQLISSLVFTNYQEFDNSSEKQLKSFDMHVQEIALKALQNMSSSAVHYYTNGLYLEAMSIENLIEQKIPDSIVLNSLLVSTDLALMQDNKQYSIAINAANRIQERFPKSKWAHKYKAEVSAKAGNTQLAEEAMGLLYKQYPTDLDIAEQYAYMLMIKNPGATIVESDMKALKILDSILEKSTSRWFAYYCKAIIKLKSSEYDLSLLMMSEFSKILQSNKKALPYYDQLIYIYALKYKDFMPMQPPRSALDNYKDKMPVLFNYIHGSYYWIAKDYSSAYRCFSYIIKNTANLSKPHYMLGNVLFERGAQTNNTDDFKSAEIEYKKTLTINNEDPHCWFSLGHLYMRMDMKQEALRAFKKTVILMPEEDHAKDKWGISIHAKMKIEELQKKLENGVK